MIYPILFLGLILRLITINQSLWLDEAIGALTVKYFDLSGIILDFMKVDNHPPLYYLFLDIWTGAFGYSEFVLRLPSVMFGLGVIYFTYKIGKTVFSHESKAPIVAALLLATSQLHVYYSQEARMYSMTAFLSAVVVYLFLLILKDTKNNWLWIIFSISILSLGFTDYLPLFLLPVLWVYLFIEKRTKKFLLKMLVAHIPLIAGYIIWYPLFNIQSGNGVWLMDILPKWTQVAGGTDIKQILLLWFKFSVGRISLPSQTLQRLLISFVTLPVLMAILINFKQLYKTKMLFLWLLLPALLTFTYSFKIPAFNYFRFIFLIPPFYLLIAGGIFVLKSKYLRFFAVIWILIINVCSLLIYFTNVSQQREDWRGAVYEIEKMIQPGEIVGFGFPEPFAPYRWYSKKPQLAYGFTNSISPKDSDTINITQKLLEHRQGMYYLEYLNDISEPRRTVRKTVEGMGYSVKKIHNFNGVGFVYYYTKL